MATNTSLPAPRPEYPRPQFVRKEWLSLNGEWEFAFDDADAGLTQGWFDGRPLPQKIIVPFAYQTMCSGINDKGIHEVVWYARSFTIPESWDHEVILLNFGAVDYRSTVWINGEEVGHNQGGHTPFSFNIAPYLKKGTNRLVVRVEDRQDPQQPRGKQAVSGVPREIYYYCTTGIWQTVWLEPVNKMHIFDIRITPLLKQQAFGIIVYLHAPAANWRLTVKLFDQGKELGRAEQITTNAASQLTVKIPNPKLWTPETPNLYDLEVTLSNDGEIYDTVRSYAGLRGIQLQDGAIHLNGQKQYLAMVLDQGYWPEGGMTAPSDEDLRKDVELIKVFGYNGVRKHQKVEDPRWLYWCDKLGLMVWGEMANAYSWSQRAEELLLAEWERVVQRDYNHPCIVAWVPMNESWGVPDLRQNHPGQYAYLERIVLRTRRLDQFRPVVDNDGWEHTDITDICAIHDYAQTGAELRKGYEEMLNHGKMRQHAWMDNIPLFARHSEYHKQPIILSEVGGFLSIPPGVPEEQRDILYKNYGSIQSNDELLARYEDLMEGIASLPFLSGFCYTQLVDVEQEMNGLVSYDRKPKVPASKVRAIHQRLFGIMEKS